MDGIDAAASADRSRRKPPQPTTIEVAPAASAATTDLHDAEGRRDDGILAAPIETAALDPTAASRLDDGAIPSSHRRRRPRRTGYAEGAAHPRRSARRRGSARRNPHPMRSSAARYSFPAAGDGGRADGALIDDGRSRRGAELVPGAATRSCGAPLDIKEVDNEEQGLDGRDRPGRRARRSPGRRDDERRRPPTRMPGTPSSRPVITWPAPRGKVNNSPRSQDASNCSPVDARPRRSGRSRWRLEQLPRPDDEVLDDHFVRRGPRWGSTKGLVGSAMTGMLRFGRCRGRGCTPRRRHGPGPQR